MKHLIIAILTAGAALLATSCDEKLGENVTRQATVSVVVTLPDDAREGTVANEQLEARSVSSGTVQTFTDMSAVTLLPGLYDFTYQADLTLPSGAQSTLRAAQTSVTVPDNGGTITLDGYFNIEVDDLIIAEVFFAGTTHASGNSYTGDDYVKLYNNTDHVIYADGLTFFETKFLTTQKYEHTPDIMATDVNVQALYTIPGSGHDHPVAPGEYLLLADTGIDHRVANPNSFDLSHADFEWYDVSTAPTSMDIDSPTVPNLDKWYCYTKSFFLLHNRGFKAYGIARIPVDRDTYLTDYRYAYDYTLVTVAGTFPMTAESYRLPNQWVVDLVTCSVESEYAWNLSSPALDSGWTHCGTMDKDPSRFFHSVRRKMLWLNEDGNPVLKDTNNSTVDFNADCIASEIEAQGTAVDAQGTPCTTRTYDGVTPVK